jgi:hypothetical protein
MARNKDGDVIAVILTDHDTYNVFGTSGDYFCVQGNLTLAQLKMLDREITRELRRAAKKGGK